METSRRCPHDMDMEVKASLHGMVWAMESENMEFRGVAMDVDMTAPMPWNLIAV